MCIDVPKIELAHCWRQLHYFFHGVKSNNTEIWAHVTSGNFQDFQNATDSIFVQPLRRANASR